MSYFSISSLLRSQVESELILIFIVSSLKKSARRLQRPPKLTI